MEPQHQESVATPMSSLVRTACLTNYRELASAMGLSPQRMLADAGLSPGVLEELDLKVPVERVRRLLEATAAAAGDESFALRMAESRQLSNLGPVGLLLREQPTPRASLGVLLRHHRLLNAALSLMVEESGGVAVVRVEILADAQPLRQVVELALGVLMRVLRQLLGPRWQPRRVCFTHSAPRDAGVHLRVFGPGVEFNQDFDGIVCASSDLDARNPAADPVMARYAQQLFDASVTDTPASTMIEEIRHAIVLLLPSGRCSIRQVSEHLGVACRTVQRRLAEQDEDFSSLVNGIRASLATRHLSEGDRPLLEVAGLLGFSAQSGFSRWHRDHFGCSPREWRAACQRRASAS
jgi:AraC-like DNA-binding protein